LVFSPSSNVASYILGGVSVRLAHPTNIDAKMKLAEIYEIIGEPRKALDLVYAGNSISLFPFFLLK
jgi:hypothetical protein